jgi:hypothetical protein
MRNAKRWHKPFNSMKYRRGIILKCRFEEIIVSIMHTGCFLHAAHFSNRFRCPIISVFQAGGTFGVQDKVEFLFGQGGARPGMRDEG